MSSVMTPPAISIPMSKEVTSKSSRSCTCEDPSPERMTAVMNSASRNRSREQNSACWAPPDFQRSRAVCHARASADDAGRSPRAAQEPQEKTATTNTSTSPSKVCTCPERTHEKQCKARQQRAEQQREQIKCPSTWSAWRLCADGGDACRGHAD